MMHLVVALGAVLGVWFAVVGLFDRLAARGAVPERLAVRVLPGWLPPYVREDQADARRARPGPRRTA